MRRIRDFLLLALFIGGTGYLAYEEWLRPLLDPVPPPVWHLAAWTWVAWTSWYAVQRLSRS